MFAVVNSQESGAWEGNVRQEEPATRGGITVAGLEGVGGSSGGRSSGQGYGWVIDFSQ